ncbi:MAG: aminopeptidase P family protein [Prevotella sp.]|nr:aminopeptidase P family protein [Prevotella sp.]
MKNRLNELREILRHERMGAFIFPSTDPHNGEYVPAHWQGREWISGFTGSAGTAVVTLHSAALWTDSRYFIQAEEQLRDSEFALMRMGMDETPSVAQWIAQELDATGMTEVGVDGMVITENTAKELAADLRKAGGYTLRTNLDPLKQIWRDRPQMPMSPVVIHPLKFAGIPAREKLQQVRRALAAQHADGMLLTWLDDIAWLLNIRGKDVPCIPVVLSYLLIGSDRATLFVDSRKLTDEVRAYLMAEGVATDEYANVGAGLQSYKDYNILMDADEVNHALYGKAKCQVICGKSPVAEMKAVKNEAEIEGFRRAMLRDGVALMKFTNWLKNGLKGHKDDTKPIMIDGEVVTEMTVCRKLEQFRSEQPLYQGVSFDTIAGYASHGAIVHYEPTEETDVALMPKGFLLIDSGAQYLDGTTDVTRTIPLGQLTDEERLVYTLVLKGHIDLQLLKFPDGAAGTQLDVVARRALWEQGYNYLHGTGHGVGAYLSVHEGPHQIRMEYRGAPLREGMTVTDEPGVYLEGRFGVRIENTLLTRRYITPLEQRGETLSPTKRFLEFETLTLCPIDTEPILWELLTAEERSWLDNYNRRVEETLAPYL